jgi:hypothetical protein
MIFSPKDPRTHLSEYGKKAKAEYDAWRASLPKKNAQPPSGPSLENQPPSTAPSGPSESGPVFPDSDTTPTRPRRPGNSPGSLTDLPTDQRFTYSRKKALILKTLDDLLAEQDRRATPDSPPKEDDPPAPPRTKV